MSESVANWTSEGAEFLAPPSVIEFEDYRRFIKEMYLYRKSRNDGFSFRKFSKIVGLRSPNYIQLVIQGKRNLSAETAERVARALSMTRLETEYFVSLVRLDNAVNENDRVKATRELRISAKNLSVQFVGEAEEEVLSNWYHLFIRDLVVLPDFVPSGKYISGKLQGLISEEEALASLRLLLQLGFLTKDSGGKIRQRDVALSTGAGVFLKTSLQNIHSQILQNWASNLEKLGPSQQELHCINIPISRKNLELLRKRVLDFQDEIIGWLKDESDPELLVQLGSYVIPFERD